MKLENCKKPNNKQYRNIVISMRITEHLQTWIKKHNLSKTQIFWKACEELGYKEE